MSARTERLLTLFFAALFFFNIAYVLLGFASVPAYYERVTTLTIEPYTIGSEVLISNEMVAAAAVKHGFSLSQYAIEQIIFSGAIVLLCSGVAALVVWRARANWFAWYSGFFMVFISEYALYNPTFAARLLPIWLIELPSLCWPLLLLYFFFFPNGHAVPRRGLWLVIPLAVVHLFGQGFGYYASLAPESEVVRQWSDLVNVLNGAIAIEIALVFVCQLYRFFRVSNRTEKQQTKWFLFGFAVFVTAGLLEDFINATPFADEISLLTFAFVPLSVGIAILRYRLWDIDVFVRRTLTYALVTALLAAVFFGSIIFLQDILTPLFNASQNDLITVLSTLLIAALFVPLRNRIQNEIDKRFNRNKYDAQQVLNDFGTTVRDETDLEKLTGRLMQVVDETMQPRMVSVWLKKEAGRAKSER